MALRRILILNFLTGVTLLAFLSWTLIKESNLKTSDKDIIIVYMVALTGLYLVLLTYFFYHRIYKWNAKRRTPYYIVMLVTVFLSLIILFGVILSAETDFSLNLSLTLIFSGLNVITYFWALLSIRQSE